MNRPTTSPHTLPRAALLLMALLAAQPATAFPLISELFYDAVGSDDGQSFVELHGTPGTVLDGWSVELVNGADGEVATTLALLGVIGPGGLYVVADRLGDGTTAVAGADLLLNFDIRLPSTFPHDRRTVSRRGHRARDTTKGAQCSTKEAIRGGRDGKKRAKSCGNPSAPKTKPRRAIASAPSCWFAS